MTTGHARGSPARPEATGEARVRKLRYGGITVQSVEAVVDLDLGDRRESNVDLRATEIDLGALALDSATLTAHGRTREHAFELRFASSGDPEQGIPGFKAKLAADGDYEEGDRGWHGTLRETSLVFQDDSAHLLQPAALEAGPAGIRAAPVCIASGEARLCVEGEWRADPASWRVLYSAQDWPLQRILHSMLGWRDFDGRLQASGWAAQEPGRPWTGGTSLVLDEPTLDIPRNQFRTDRVSLGAARLDVYAEPEEIRATLDANVADSTRLEGELKALRAPGRDLLDLPLSGEIRGESSAITAMPLFVPEIDRSGGQLDGRVSVSGTLGNPRFDGEFHVRDGRFDLYRTNLQLSKRDAGRPLRRRRAGVRGPRLDRARRPAAGRPLCLARERHDRDDAAVGRGPAGGRHARLPHRRLARPHLHRRPRRLRRDRPGADPDGADHAAGTSRPGSRPRRTSASSGSRSRTSGRPRSRGCAPASASSSATTSG